MAEQSNEPLYHVSTSPHIRYRESVPGIMRTVCIALIPAFAASIYFFGIRSAALTAVCVAAAVGSEWLVTRIFNRPSTIHDLSAVITGILLAFNLPVGFPLWMAALGSVFAIVVVKWAFGGLGHNFINPALAGRAFLMASYPAQLTSFTAPNHGTIHGLSAGIDGISSATPLEYYNNLLQTGNFQPLELQEALGNLFWGNVGGCIGETSAAALLLGAILLWYKHVIGFKVPFCYIATVFILYWLFNGTGGYFSSEAFIVPVFQVLSGGLMLGALYMATDMVTSPITPMGKILFGCGCGVLTFIIRKFGGYPEGVSYSILLMNLVAPLLDRYTRPRILGKKKTS